MQELVLSLDERGRNGAHTTMVKVHGHTGEPLHAVADAMPTEGADRKMEVDDTRLSPSSLRTAVSPLPAPAGLPLPGYEISPHTRSCASLVPYPLHFVLTSTTAWESAWWQPMDR